MIHCTIVNELSVTSYVDQRLKLRKTSMPCTFAFHTIQRKKNRYIEDGRCRIDEIILFILKRLYVEVNSSVGTRYIQWRCLMLPGEMNGNIHGICVEMLMNGIRDRWYDSNASYNVNVNVPSFKFNNVEY